MTNAKTHNEFPFSVEALAQYLSGIMEVGDVTLTPITGGLSNPSYFVDLGHKKIVLRKQPEGELAPSAHAIDREYRIMQALYDTDVPVPEMLHFCEDKSIIGTPFFVMEFLEGRVFHQVHLPEMTPTQRRDIFDEMNRVLVALHNVDPAAVGLDSFGRPEGFLERQVKRWSKQYEACQTRDIPEITDLAQWLAANTPEQASSSIVHGDYRLGNLMFHPTEPRVVGVLDWELSTLGDPLADLGYNLLPWTMKPAEYFGLNGLDLKDLGIPDAQAYAQQYLDRMGVKTPYNQFYTCLAFFRLAVIFEGVISRAKAAGKKPPSDPAVGDITGFGQIFARHGLTLTGE